MLRVLCDVVLCHLPSCVGRLVRWHPELEAGDVVACDVVAGDVVAGNVVAGNVVAGDVV